MDDFLLVVEAFLDEEGIFHRRDATGQLLFELPFGRTSYECLVHQADQTLDLAAFWNGNIDQFQVDDARKVLDRLNNAGSYDGQTFINLHEGWVCHMVSVEIVMAKFNVQRARAVLENLLDPFNVKLLAMEYVLNGKMSEDAAVECYAAWDRSRVTKLVAPMNGGGFVDRRLN